MKRFSWLIGPPPWGKTWKAWFSDPSNWIAPAIGLTMLVFYFVRWLRR